MIKFNNFLLSCAFELIKTIVYSISEHAAKKINLMMKKLFVFIVILSVSLVFHSCEKEKSFNESFLIGKWRSGTEYYKYLSDLTGATWDEADDVHEDEAQP